MAKLLLVEDDVVLANMVTSFLRKESYIVEHTANGEQALEMMLSFDFDVVIIDWDLPGKSGVQIIEEYRKNGGQACLCMLTAKESIEEKALGFGVGSDDYLTKPFHPAELSMRIKSLLRRSSKQKEQVYTFGSLCLDPTTRMVQANGNTIDLTTNEFRLLELLMRFPNHVMSTDTIMSRAWSSDVDISMEAVRICITRLRKKIGQFENCPSIVNVYGEGYSLRMPADDSSSKEEPRARIE